MYFSVDDIIEASGKALVDSMADIKSIEPNIDEETKIAAIDTFAAFTEALLHHLGMPIETELEHIDKFSKLIGED